MFPVAIHQLDSHVIDHIAAGEVVERPASVAKELLENACDAGAGLVQIDLGNGGLERLTVTDDGYGMRPDDARRCILRHATSKMRVATDLSHITTLGFRGEALSSIAAIARVTITTRPSTADQGFRIVVHGGKVVQAEAVGCPRGTCVDVRDLFYNTPARRKFMRAPATEQAHVVEAGLRVALGAGEAGLVITAGTRRLLDIPEADGEAGRAFPAVAADESAARGATELQNPTADLPTAALARRVAYSLGQRLGPLTPLGLVADGVHVSGFISRPQLARSDTRGLWTFVNGRFVRDRMLQRALLDAFQSVCPGQFPTAVVWLRLDPEAVDVNVHPQKLEVRFADAHAVYGCLGQAIVQALAPPTGHVQAPLWVTTSAAARGWPAAPKGRGQANTAGAMALGATANARLRGPPAGAARSGSAPSGGRGQTSSAGAMANARLRPLPAGAAPQDVARHHVQAAAVRFALGKGGLRRQPPDAAPRRGGMQSKPPFAAGRRHVPVPSTPQRLLPIVSPAASTRSQRPREGFADVARVDVLVPGYIVGRCADALVVIDAGAAARLLAARALATVGPPPTPLLRRQLMLPPTFTARPAWAARLATACDALTAYGLEIDPVGPQQYAIRAIPAALGDAVDPVAVTLAGLEVILRGAGPDDAASLRRGVDARWLDLVATAAAAAPVAGHADLLQALASTDIALADAPCVLRLGTAAFAKLFMALKSA